MRKRKIARAGRAPAPLGGGRVRRAGVNSARWWACRRSTNEAGDPPPRGASPRPPAYFARRAAPRRQVAQELRVAVQKAGFATRADAARGGEGGPRGEGGEPFPARAIFPSSHLSRCTAAAIFRTDPSSCDAPPMGRDEWRGGACTCASPARGAPVSPLALLGGWTPALRPWSPDSNAVREPASETRVRVY